MTDLIPFPAMPEEEDPQTLSRETLLAQAQELREILEKHLSATGSEKAARILEDFDAALPNFKMVVSAEYRRVLEGR